MLPLRSVDDPPSDAGPSVASLLSGLTEAQAEAVTAPDSPLCILAGAGSGKTRVLTRRIAYRCVTGDADARHVLALTFTRKAAGELRTRLRALGLRDRIQAGTFHAVAYAQLRQYWSDHGRQPPALLDSKFRVVGRLVSRGGRLQTADVVTEIEWAKARLVGPDHYPDAAADHDRRTAATPETIATLYQRYEEEKRRRRVVDFDDLLWLCAQAIERDPDLAAAQRWNFRHLHVDEFQDVNPLQLRLLEAWRGGRTDLCVVGDPNQAIYAWNGADPAILDQFPRRFGGRIVVLADNHRSTPQVLATANQILDSGRLGGVRLRPTRGDGPLPTVVGYPDDVAEATATARALRDRHGPMVPWGHQAVLTRTNAQTVLVAEACRAAGIPIRLRGQKPFLDLPEVKEVLTAWQRSRRPFLDQLAAFEGSVEDLRDAEVGADLDPDRTAPEPTEAEEARVRSLEELLRLTNEYAAEEPHPSIAGLLAWLTASVGDDDLAADGDAVDVVTFHAAKGLEWPIVHAIGLEAGLVPISHAKSPGALAEERRLFYVVVTRAERELRMTWAAQRSFGTRTVARRRSPFLDDIEPLLQAMASGAAPADADQHLPAVREVVRAARGGLRPGTGDRRPRAADLGDADRALFEALRTWRAGRARAAGVAPYVVVDDEVLARLATARPASRPELREVAGLGAVRAERFADELLAIVAAHAPA